MEPRSHCGRKTRHGIIINLSPGLSFEESKKVIGSVQAIVEKLAGSRMPGLLEVRRIRECPFANPVGVSGYIRALVPSETEWQSFARAVEESNPGRIYSVTRDGLVEDCELADRDQHTASVTIATDEHQQSASRPDTTQSVVRLQTRQSPLRRTQLGTGSLTRGFDTARLYHAAHDNQRRVCCKFLPSRSVRPHFWTFTSTSQAS